MMKKTYITYILLILLIGCAAPDFYSLEDIEKERVKLESGKTKVELI